MDSFEASEERFRNLERRCARLRLWCLGVTVVALSSCLSSALRPKADTIEARSFIVRGPDGLIRASLGFDHEACRLSLRSNDQLGIVDLMAVDRTEDSQSGAGLFMEADQADGGGMNSIVAAVGSGESGMKVFDETRSVETLVRKDRASVHVLTNKQGADHQETATFPDENGEANPSLRLDITGDKATIAGSSATGTTLFKQP